MLRYWLTLTDHQRRASDSSCSILWMFDPCWSKYQSTFIVIANALSFMTNIIVRRLLVVSSRMVSCRWKDCSICMDGNGFSSLKVFQLFCWLSLPTLYFPTSLKTQHVRSTRSIPHIQRADTLLTHARHHSPQWTRERIGHSSSSYRCWSSYGTALFMGAIQSCFHRLQSLSP